MLTNWGKSVEKRKRKQKTGNDDRQEVGVKQVV